MLTNKLASAHLTACLCFNFWRQTRSRDLVLVRLLISAAAHELVVLLC